MFTVQFDYEHTIFTLSGIIMYMYRLKTAQFGPGEVHKVFRAPVCSAHMGWVGTQNSLKKGNFWQIFGTRWWVLMEFT